MPLSSNGTNAKAAYSMALPAWAQAAVCTEDRSIIWWEVASLFLHCRRFFEGKKEAWDSKLGVNMS